MNKKLQTLIEEFSSELQTRFPGVTLDVYPRHRKSVYLYVTAPEKGGWDGDGVWDIVESMSQKEVDTLVKTGYSIRLLPRWRHQPQPSVLYAQLRETMPEWNIEESVADTPKETTGSGK